jgi:hypothetical protein
MLHACDVRFNMTRNLENFLYFGWIKRGQGLKEKSPRRYDPSGTVRAHAIFHVCGSVLRFYRGKSPRHRTRFALQPLVAQARGPGRERKWPREIPSGPPRTIRTSKEEERPPPALAGAGLAASNWKPRRGDTQSERLPCQASSCTTSARRRADGLPVP